jgi:hypothetical protein
VQERPDKDLERRGRRHRTDPDEFFGLDVETMSPRAQVAAGLAVLVPVVVGAVLVLTLFQWVWWLVFVFGWMVFPAFGLLVRGIAGLSEGEGSASVAGSSKERELLEVLREHGEITPTRAVMETSLPAAEADKMLKGARGGRAPGGVGARGWVRLPPVGPGGADRGRRRGRARVGMAVAVGRGCMGGIIPFPGSCGVGPAGAVA